MMKKFTLVALAMMASASCFAQKQILWDGEDKEIGEWNNSNGFWDRLSPAVAENPAKDGINTSEKCVKFTITGNEYGNGSIVLPINDGLNMSTNKRLSIMIKKPLWSNVIIELSDGTYHKKIAANYGGGNEGKWQKLVFDFTNNCDFGNVNPTQLAIYPGIENGQEPSQEIYVDNIVLEDNPIVDGLSLWNAKESSLRGNLNLTGNYFKTECMNVDNNWEKINIDDFVELNKKLSADVTSIDMRKASTLGVDINQFFFKNPNTIVYADAAYDHANVVVNGTAKNLELNEANAFNAPEGFTAESVKLTRDVREGINSFVLPFKVTADELGASKVATYNGCDLGKNVANFITAESVGDNIPFLTMDVAEDNAAVDKVLTFTNKDIVATPDNLGENFVGVYAPQNAEGIYGIDDKGMLHEGGAKATIAAFHAYLDLNVKGPASTPARIAINGSILTAINGVTADKVANTAVYDLSGRRVYGKLQKGLYIMNGKKVVVK